MALTYTPAPELGSPCPDFQLPGVDGHLYGREDFAGSKALIVMFICNHCPYVKAIEDRLIALGNYLRNSGAAIVAISSNDSEKYPEDSFINMKKRFHEKNYPFPYLHDDSQDVAKRFGAVCTPDFFVYDADLRLAYRGRLDDSWKDATQVRSQELKDAVEALLKGHKPDGDQKPSMGCSIKWKE